MMVRFLRGILARRLIRRRIADRVLACFEGINLARQTFQVNGASITSPSGENRFYEAGEIDRAIANINKLLGDLRE